ncbi:BMP family ABC transporter substrate-binding protein [Streptosporangium carneum]|uniref:BMP family ABC transporter substrate-binding protein n=1 Tax=Streptosporangium carneum TaxID=47481 RepID=A0A9W6IAI4_9ACTN|nr:BMP family ABC transporter substrate-binding protein [Streptosporangium carneum]
MLRTLRTTVALTASLTTLALAGCTQSVPSANERPAGKASPKVGLLYAGGLGDFSYNDLAHLGLEKVEKDLGIPVKGVETKADATDGEKTQLVEALIDSGHDPIIGMTFSYSKVIDQAASRHPNVRFAVIDGDPTNQPNVSRLTFAVEQGSFLVGAAAALKSKTKRIGFVGGMESPEIQKFEAGYTAGAKKIDPGVDVLVKYITQAPDFSGFRDPAKGGIAAKGQFDKGADVIFHSAGATGTGVIEAAAATGKQAIGVDSDQYNQPGLAAVRDHILTSMVKRVDVAVFDFAAQVKAGRFSAGTRIYDLSNRGVGYTTSGGEVDDIADELNALEKEIAEGRIKVPEKP